MLGTGFTVLKLLDIEVEGVDVLGAHQVESCVGLYRLGHGLVTLSIRLLKNGSVLDFPHGLPVLSPRSGRVCGVKNLQLEQQGPVLAGDPEAVISGVVGDAVQYIFAVAALVAR